MTETKRCNPPSKDGCYQVKPIGEFICGFRTRADETRTPKMSGYCLACRQRRDSEKHKRRRDAEKAEEIRIHNEYMSAFNAFMRVKPTEPEKVRRYEINT